MTQEILTNEIVFPVSHSRLSSFKKSPLHLYHHLFKPKEESYAQKIGKAFHSCILEPDDFENNYVKSINVDRRTKEGKASYSQFAIENIGKTIISEEDYDKIILMKESLYKSEKALELLNDIKYAEHEKLWKNKETNINMRGFIDAVGSNFLLELKTTQDANADKFQKDSINYGYYRQAAIYLDSDKEYKNHDFYFIAVEKEAPYAISIHKCTKELIDYGREQFLNLLREYEVWVNRGMPIKGYEYWNFDGVYEFELPRYMK